MKRFFCHFSLLYRALFSKIATAQSWVWAESPKLHVAIALSCLLAPIAFGQGGLSLDGSRGSFNEP